jgi:hypothetical protein
MAKLINGNGNLAIYAEEDADWYASIFGNQTSITGIGNQFAYSLLDANTIGVEDGVIITKEGRRIQLNANEIDEFEIPNGSQGTTNYYIIGYRLITDETSAQTCETFVELMDNGTDTIPEGSFREGDDSVDVSLYRVKQEDLTITAVTLLLPKVGAMSAMANDIATLNTKLTEMEGKIMPNLDYGNPLHTFSSGNLTYTATKTCYLMGGIESTANSATTVSINGTLIVSVAGSAGRPAMSTPSLIKLNAGDIVTVNTAINQLHVFDVVS